MGKVYVGQTALTIKATVNQNIAGAIAKTIKYKKPDGSTGSFNSVSIDDENGVIKKEISSASEINQSGTWTFWAEVTFSDGKIAPGEPYERKFFEPGS